MHSPMHQQLYATPPHPPVDARIRHGHHDARQQEPEKVEEHRRGRTALLEDIAGEGLGVKPESTPSANQRWHHYAETEAPDQQ